MDRRNKLFHINNGYYVKVKSVPGSIGCAAEFPNNIIENVDKLNKIYLINDDYALEVYSLTEEKPINSRKLLTPAYVTRVLIVEDIVVQAQARNMSTDLITIVDDDENLKNITLFDLLKIEMDEEDTEKETILCKCLFNLLQGKTKDVKIEEEGLLEGYDFIVNCFENGGL